MDLRSQILAVKDVPLTKVFVEEWGVDVYIKPMTGKAQDEFDQVKYIENDGTLTVTPNITAKYIQKVVCDEKGTLLFGEADIDVLGAKSSKALSKIYQASIKNSGATVQAQEELGKN